MADLHLSIDLARDLRSHNPLKRGHRYLSHASKVIAETNKMNLLPQSRDGNWLWSFDTTPERSIARSGNISFGVMNWEDLSPFPMEILKISTQFKGVVPQLNGKWGAQIYEKNQRIWLGTFNTEDEAARAYDRAALKYRGSQVVTNFTKTANQHEDRIEEAFLSRYTKEEVVDMLRRHTYEDELDEYSRRAQTLQIASSKQMQSKESIGHAFYDAFASHNQSLQHRKDNVENGREHVETNTQDFESSTALNDLDYSGARLIIQNAEHLFDKSLTPSDVGKLNRLVIPKQHAERWFPLVMNNNEKGLMMTLQDSLGKMWRFRYSYWASSQSYVFTKGWSAFVKEKKLKAGDVVSFREAPASSFHKRHLIIICKPSLVSDGLQQPAIKAPCNTSAAGTTTSQSNTDMDHINASLQAATSSQISRSMEQVHADETITHTNYGAEDQLHKQYKRIEHDMQINESSNYSGEKHKVSHQLFNSTPSIMSSSTQESNLGRNSSCVSDKINDKSMNKPYTHPVRQPYSSQHRDEGTFQYSKSPLSLELFRQASIVESNDNHVVGNQKGLNSCLKGQCFQGEKSSASIGGLRLFGVDMEVDMVTGVVNKECLKKPSTTLHCVASKTELDKASSDSLSENCSKRHRKALIASNLT